MKTLAMVKCFLKVTECRRTAPGTQLVQRTMIQSLAVRSRLVKHPSLVDNSSA